MGTSTKACTKLPSQMSIRALTWLSHERTDGRDRIHKIVSSNLTYIHVTWSARNTAYLAYVWWVGGATGAIGGGGGELVPVGWERNTKCMAQ